MQSFFFHCCYVNYVDCDVVPMEACSLLLGRPWEFDNDGLHHGKSNTYTFMHQGKKITLLPMTPVLALLKYPFYPLFILDNGMNLISKSLTVLTPA